MHILTYSHLFLNSLSQDEYDDKLLIQKLTTDASFKVRIESYFNVSKRLITWTE